MRQHSRARIAFPVAIAAIALMSVPLAGQFGEGFELTVTQDRLINAQDEPQNWLLMNGDYGSQRFSKLTQINRDNVDNLRMVWALALGGMIGTGANGPENEVNPLIDNGFMYATDGWGTVYKIDARNPNYGEFVWITDPGVDQEVNRPRTRGIALWEDKVLQNLQDGRVLALDRDDGEILWDVEVAGTNEFGSRERFLTAPIVADGKVLVQNGAGDGGTRGWVAALDVDTGEELWRWYTVPAPGEPGSETWKDDNHAWKTGGGGVWQTGSYDPVNNLYIFGTGNPYPIYDAEYRPGDNLYTNSAVALDVATGERRWHFQYTPNDSWDYDEVGVHMLYDTVINGEERQVVAHFGRNGFFYSLDRETGEFIKGDQYVNELTWTAGLNQETGKPQEYDPNLDIQIYNEEARALRSDRDLMKRACPTWHGGVAHQPTAFNPDKGIAYGAGTEGCFSQTGAQVFPLGPDGGIDREASQQRDYTSDLYYGSITAVDSDTQEVIAKAVTEIENPLRGHRHRRRPDLHRASGRLDRRLRRRDAAGAVALQRRHAAQGRAGDLRDWSDAVPCGAGERAPPAPGQVRQPGELQLPVYLRPRPVDRVRRPSWCGSSTGAPAFLVRRPPGRHRAPRGIPVRPRPVLVRRPPGRQEG